MSSLHLVHDKSVSPVDITAYLRAYAHHLHGLKRPLRRVEIDRINTIDASLRRLTARGCL